MILYLHGFNSSPASFKAQLLATHLAKINRGRDFLAPCLPHAPAQAIAVIEGEISRHAAGSVALVGSSLGGYYATWLAEKHGLKAALVNPAVRPYVLLQRYLGRQRNLYTGEEFDLHPEYLNDLKAFDVETLARPERYLLLVQTGDEVLDYRMAVDKYRGARQIVIAGGDHAFRDFGRHIETILAFLSGKNSEARI